MKLTTAYLTLAISLGPSWVRSPATMMAYSSETLEEAILKDNMPPSSTQCISPSDKAQSDFTYHSSQATSKWYGPFAPFEEGLFLAKMTHKDNSDNNHDWTIRFGQGGNIYSMVGKMGETVPPQNHPGAPWIDEVWQTVSQDNTLNDIDNNALDDACVDAPFYIHEAGAYQYDHKCVRIDDDYDTVSDVMAGADGIPPVDLPFYSPNLGKYCDDSIGECNFVSWGQQAHIPTNFSSGMLNFNRYKDCGDGVIEYTTLRHNNNDGISTTMDFITVPWGGVRLSTFGGFVKSDTNNNLIADDPIPRFNQRAQFQIDETSGYIGFTEKESTTGGGEVHPRPYLLPPGVDLVMSDTECLDRDAGGRFKCILNPTTSTVLPAKGSPGEIVRLTGSSGCSFVAGVSHWSFESPSNGLQYLVFYADDHITIDFVRSCLPAGPTAGSTGSTIQVSYDDPYPLPNPNLDLVVSSTGCYDRDAGGRFKCFLEPTVVEPLPQMGDPGEIVVLTGSTGCSFVAGVRHWAWQGNKLLFYADESIDIVKVNQCLPPGSRIDVSMHYTLSLSHVFGTKTYAAGTTDGFPNNNIGAKVQYGRAAAARNYNVYGLVSGVNIPSGSSYYYRQYYMLGKKDDIVTKGSSWAAQTVQGLYDTTIPGGGGPVGRTVKLYADAGGTGGGAFGATVGTSSSCLANEAVWVCDGSTTPQPNTQALYQIRCSTDVIVTEDPYYFAPASLPKRPYICEGHAGSRAEWFLLGFFNPTHCTAIMNGNYEYDESYCSII